MRKICNNCGFQQDEFLNLDGRNYCKGCNSEINVNSNQTLEQKQKTLHQMKLLLGNFHYMLEPLEDYIERAGYYPNFRSKRQLYRKSIKSSNGPLENDEDLFLTQLFVFAAAAHGKPQFFREAVREEFYKWINHIGIAANNCPERLKHFLIEINNILDGNDEKILRETRERDKNVEIDPKAVVGIFGSILQPLNRNRDQRVALEGKNWDELPDDDKFEGDPDLGKQAFEQIKLSVSIPHEQFMLRKSEAETLQQIDALIEERNSGMEGIEFSGGGSQSLKLEKSPKNARQPQKSNDKGIGIAGIFAIIGVVSALAISSLVVIRKKMNKKLKK
jgi:hypothetical protein